MIVSTVVFRSLKSGDGVDVRQHKVLHPGGRLDKWPRRKPRPLGSGYRDRVRTQLNESTAKRNFELSQRT